MKAARLRPAGHFPNWGAALWRAFQRLVSARAAATGTPRRRADTPLGPLEARAVEKALLQWVQLQRSGSKTVPVRRVDSD